ncbi:NrdH-redoxin [Candidatus Daviesbacteria bacterium]|nr:NrdH-redoxin [Candidatus Daviesbacteria bacterium]
MKVKIYSTTTCPFCKMEKQYLEEKGIQYENIFVDQQPDEAKRLIEESGQMGVPFTEITKDDGEVVKILGFDKNKLNEALGLVNV